MATGSVANDVLGAMAAPIKPPQNTTIGAAVIEMAPTAINSQTLKGRDFTPDSKKINNISQHL